MKEFIHELKERTEADRIRFYEQLGFQLTIAIRSIGSEQMILDAEKLRRLKLINEMVHRTFQWVWRLRKGDRTLTDETLFNDLKVYIGECKEISSEVSRAVRESLHAINAQSIDPR